MKKIFFLTIGLFVGQCLLSQNNSKPQRESIPLPPSPTAYQFSTYGNIGLNNNSGSVNYTVPIYTIQDKDITFPISMAYTSNGVRIDYMAGIVGIDWVLNGGGVISRVIRSQPDVKGGTFWYPKNNLPAYEPEDLSSYNDVDRDKAVDIAEGILPANTERDWYSFNVNGLSGTFYRDDNGGFIIDSEEYVKIIEETSHRFKIIDSKGFIYKFDIAESTSIETGFSTGNSNESAWYLTELTTPTGNNLKISYLVNHFSYTLGFSATLMLKAPGRLLGIDNIPSSNLNAIDNISSSRMTVLGRVISKIEFSSGTIEFVYNDESMRLDKAGLLLKKIKIYSKEDLLQQIELKYAQVKSISGANVVNTSSDDRKPDLYRYFLENINFENKNGQVGDIYTFEYYNKESLPQRLSARRDVYGYYNNASGLFDLDYIVDDRLKKLIEVKASTSYLFGNAKPDPQYTYYGVLKTITYPTGGKTEFTYENNKTEEEGERTEIITIRESISLLAESGVDVNGSGDPININYKSRKLDFIAESDYVEINGGANVFTQEGASFNKNVFYEIGIKNIATGRYIFSKKELLSGKPFSEKISLNKGAKYKLEVAIEPDRNDNHPYATAHVMVQANVLYDLESEPILVKYKKDVYAGGVRVSNIKDLDEKGNVLNEKKYYYNTLANIGSSTSTLQYYTYREPQKYIMTIIPGHTETDGGFHGTQYSVDDHAAFVFKSSTLPLIFNTRNRNAAYSDITEVSTNNGAIERSYLNEYEEQGRDILGGSFNVPGSNVKNGFGNRLALENFYKQQGGGFTLVKSRYYQYNSVNSQKLRNLYLERTFVDYFYYRKPNEATPGTIGNVRNKEAKDMVYISIYDDWVNNVRLFATSEKWYNDKKEVIYSQRIDNSYSSGPYFSMKKQVISGSNKTQKIEEYKYPQDLKGQLEYMDQLEKESRVGIPIITTHKIINQLGNTILTGYDQTLYGKYEFSPNNILYLPKKIESYGHTNDLIEQISFLNYNKYGNPISIYENDAMKSVYLWSYKGLYPVAQIKNTTYDEVSKLIDIQALTDTYLPNMDLVNGLRQRLPNAQINTYAYTPLVGVTAITAPSGITTYYDYDVFGRLKSVKDNDGNQLANYAYSIRSSEVKPIYPDMDINLTSTTPNKLDTSGIFEVSVKGGSGKFTYSWFVNNELKEKDSKNTKHTTFFDKVGNIIIKCIVTDQETEEQIEKTLIAVVGYPSIKISNVNISGDNGYSMTKTIYATVTCPIPTQVNFRIGFEGNPNNRSAYATYQIGNYNNTKRLSDNERTNNGTVTLPKGSSTLKIQLQRSNTNESGMAAWIYLENAVGNNFEGETVFQLYF